MCWLSERGVGRFVGFKVHALTILGDCLYFFQLLLGVVDEHIVGYL